MYRTLARQAGENAALDAVGIMGQVAVVPLAVEDAVHVARLGLSCSLPLADSIIYVIAPLRDAELWTHDEHFRGLPGVGFVEPPPDRGRPQVPGASRLTAKSKAARELKLSSRAAF